jgi:hypothetical protein
MKKLHIKDRLQAIPLANYIVFSNIIILLYSIAEFVFSTITGVSHETLTTCVYAFFGTEIASCAFIKVYKLKQETDTVDFDE